MKVNFIFDKDSVPEIGERVRDCIITRKGKKVKVGGKSCREMQGELSIKKQEVRHVRRRRRVKI